MQKTKLFFALWLASLSASAIAQVEEEKIPEIIHCPEPNTILYTPIPSSIHGVYSAVSDETGFGALSLGFFDPAYLSFSSAEVSEINGYWRIYCSYRSGGTYLNLASNVQFAYSQCDFKNETQNCEGSIEDCTILCPREDSPVLAATLGIDAL